MYFEKYFACTLVSKIKFVIKPKEQHEYSNIAQNEQNLISNVGVPYSY